MENKYQDKEANIGTLRPDESLYVICDEVMHWREYTVTSMAQHFSCAHSPYNVGAKHGTYALRYLAIALLFLMVMDELV